MILAAKNVLVLLAMSAALTASSPAADKGNLSPIYGVKLPDGYRNWQMISVASVGPPQSDLRVKLGNQLAMQAYRSGKRPFPDGAIIARLAYKQAVSAEGNAVFGAGAAKLGLTPDQVEKFLAGSFVAGAPTNVQIMVKDSKRYASTGGWGFGEFTNGKPDGEPVHRNCFSCHAPGKDRDFVFTDYAP
jgi:hypothetical protein